MDYKHTAAEILKYVGTEKNVAHLEHCSTRLRFTLNDQKKVDEDKLKAVPGVMGVVRSNQFQIIIGNEVAKCFAELKKLDVASSDEPAEKSKEKLDAQGCRQRHPGLYLRKHVRADPRIDRGWNDPGAAHDPLLMRSDQ